MHIVSLATPDLMQIGVSFDAHPRQCSQRATQIYGMNFS